MIIINLVTVTFVGSGMAMLVKCSLSLRVETNVRVGIWSTCFLSKCYRWKHCRIIIVASNVSSYGVIIRNQLIISIFSSDKMKMYWIAGLLIQMQYK